MSWIGRLFGTAKAVDSLVDKDNGLLVRAGGWIDGLSHTDQEKARDSLLVKEWGIRQLEALGPFKIVQRVLAISVTFFWAFIGVNVIVAIWVEAIFGVSAKESMMEFAFSDFVFWPVLAVLSLYFTGGIMPGRKGAS